jgi:MFS family permease
MHASGPHFQCQARLERLEVMPSSEESSEPSRLAILTDRDFRCFFLGNAVSKIGDSPIPVAFAIATYQITGQAGGIAAVLLSLWSTRLVMVGPGGSLADRFNRVTVMMIADVIRFVAQASLALLIFSPVDTEVWHLCLSAAVYGVGSALYVPAQIGFLPQLVKAGDLPRANALFGILADVSVVLGPALAGLLMTTVGFGWLLVIDCVSFLANILFIAGLRCRAAVFQDSAAATAATGKETPDHGGHGFLSSLRLTRQFPWFTAGLGLWFFVSLGIGLVSVAGPTIAVAQLSGIGAWSVLSTFLAIGSLLGSSTVIVAARILTWRGAAATTAVGLLPQYVLLGLADSAATLWLLAPSFLLAGLVTAVCGTIWDAEYQDQLPQHHLSRLGSLENFVNTAGVPVGMLLGGLTAHFYMPTYTALGTIVFLFGLLCAALARGRRDAQGGATVTYSAGHHE